MLKTTRVIAVLLAGIMGTVARAEVTTFWESSPTLPDQTVLVQGDGFSENMEVVVARLKDSNPGRPGGRAAEIG